MRLARFVLVVLCALFSLLSCVLVSRILSSNREKLHLVRKTEELISRNSCLLEEFKLKQDYMRKIISNDEIVEEIIREKMGLSKPNEIIFKFDD